MSIEPAEYPIVFRAPKPLRVLLAGVGALSGAAAVFLVWKGSANAGAIFAALILMVPCIVAAAALRKRIEVTPEALRSVTLLYSRVIPWSRVARLDQKRRSFVVETELGPVSAGWIAPAQRDRLLRLIMQYAKLLPSGGQQKWGLKMRFIPRQQTIRLEERNKKAE